MKTIVVLSDTHGSQKTLSTLSNVFAENDYVIHLGDGAGDMRVYMKDNPEKFFVMRGNCDFCSALDEWVLEVEGVRIFMAHGHQYGVKHTLSVLAETAKKKNCSVALYGHTHIADVREIDGVTCINPGTAKSPLSFGGSYAYLVVHGDKLVSTIVGQPYVG